MSKTGRMCNLFCQLRARTTKYLCNVDESHSDLQTTPDRLTFFGMSSLKSEENNLIFQ